MADVNDTRNVQQTLAKEWERLDRARDDGDLDPRDHEEIRDYIEDREVGGDKLTTIVTYLQKLRLWAVRADTPLVDMERNDVNQAVKQLTAPKDEGGYGVGNGIEGYKNALRPFLRDHLRREWVTDHRGHTACGGLKPDTSNKNGGDHYNPDDALLEADITDLKEAAKNPRDRAFVAFLSYTGVRISLALSLRIKDLSGIDTDHATFRPNPDAEQLKGVPIQDFVLDKATLPVRQFLREGHPHPRNHPKREEAPLFPVVQGYDPEDPEGSAWSYNGARDALKRLADRGGVERPVNPHNFRHSLATRMLASGDHDPTDFQTVFAWDSRTLTEMIDYYQGVKREDLLDRLRQNRGYEVDIEDGEAEPPKECHVCGHENEPTAEVCDQCSADISEGARRESVKAWKRVQELNERVEQIEAKAEQPVGAAKPTAATVEGTLTETAEMKAERYDDLKDENEEMKARLEKLEALLVEGEEPVE